jgi:3-mercaptopyruvate sulfurtransferase SseA
MDFGSSWADMSPMHCWPEAKRRRRVDSLNTNSGKIIFFCLLSPLIKNIFVKSKEIVLYCFIGQTACVDYVAGRSLGYTIKVYNGSMQEWSRDEKLPMEKTKKE